MIKTIIIEDNVRYRELLKTMLASSEKFELIHEYDNCRDIINEIVKQLPDIIIMDIDLPGKSGIDAVAEIKDSFPEIKIMMLTVFEDEEKIFGAIKAGANGYLLKKDPPQKIFDALIDIYEGNSPMNVVIAKKVLEYFHHPQKINPDLENSKLTDREKEILNELMKGLSYKEIASTLFISVETLNSHIKNIYRKLNVHSRSELAAKYGNTP